MADEQILIDDGLFPIDDGIAYTIQNGIDPRYDLRKLMSNTMRSRPQWEDFAAAASRVLFEEVERHRRALGLARTPENLSRAFKITALKMLGLDYRSDLLRDSDYDRALNTIALHNKSKGPEDFVRYMGFIKDAKFEMARLWTTDYQEFVDGPAVGWRKVYDSPPGEWFPTTHVGLLYEEFSNKTPIDDDDLRALFYRMAPINLVLDWIASMLTISIGTLYLALNFYEEGEETGVIRVEPPKLNLYMYTGVVEDGEDEVHTSPKGLASTAYMGTGLRALEVTFDKAAARRGPLDWSAATGTNDVSWDVTQFVEPVLVRSRTGIYEGRTSPVYDEYNASRDLIGTSLVPERWNFVPGSDDPAAASYLKTGVTLSPPGNTYIDGGRTRLISVTGRGYVTLTALPSGRKVVTWIFRPNATSHVALERGGERVILNVGSLLMTKSSSSTWAEAEFLGGGWIRFSAALPGDELIVYPAWGPTTGTHADASGSVFWYRLQVEDSLYPSRATATANGLPRLRPSTRWTLPGDQLNYPAGFFFLNFMIPYPEWESGVLDLFEFIGPRSRLYAKIGTDARLTMGVLNDAYRHELPDDATDRPAPIVARSGNKLAVAWDAAARTFDVYLNGWSSRREDIAWPTNFNRGAIGRTAGANVRFTSYIKRMTLMGVASPSQLPSPAALLHLTS